MAKNFSAYAKLNKWESIEFALLYGIVYTLSLLPFCILYIISDFTYLILYHVVGYRKGVVRKNLRNSFPDKSNQELRSIERKFYHFLCDLIFETIKGASINQKEMKKRLVFNGVEHIEKAISERHNVALYLAHYCNWEWVTSITLWVSPDIYMGQIYHILESKVMDKLMLRLRSRWGTVNIPRIELLRRIVEQKKAGKQMMIGFISDQGPEMHNINYWTNFLHQDTAVISGTEVVARKYDFTCLYLKLSRPKRGYYVCDIEVMTSNPKSEPEFAITEKYARMLEQNINEHPELWLWSHNRWKRTRQHWEQYLVQFNRAKDNA